MLVISLLYWCFIFFSWVSSFELSKCKFVFACYKKNNNSMIFTKKIETQNNVFFLFKISWHPFWGSTNLFPTGPSMLKLFNFFDTNVEMIFMWHRTLFSLKKKKKGLPHCLSFCRSQHLQLLYFPEYQYSAKAKGECVLGFGENLMKVS